MNPLELLAWYFLQPDFMQAMTLCTGAFLLTLERRSHWLGRYLIALAGCFLAGGFMSIFYGQFENGWLLDNQVRRFLFLGVFLLLPLTAAYLIFRACASLSRADAVYATACVYAIQHTEFCLSMIVADIWKAGFWLSVLRNWLLLFGVLALSYFTVIRGLQCGGRYGVSRWRALTVAGIMLMIGLVLNYPLRTIPHLRDSMAYALCLAYDLFSCQFLLWLQMGQRREIQLAASAEAERRLRLQIQDQYQLSEETIGIINRKCHDLKHQIAGLRLVTSQSERDRNIAEIEQSVMIYDAAAQTGNRVLDTVLTEKSLLCERCHISWSCMAEGSLLNFLSPVDLYTLFGNALNNAIEGSVGVEDPEMRNVSVTVQRRLGAAFIQIENYFSGPLKTQNGRLLSTKPDGMDHGFGLQSISAVAARYGGAVDVSAQDNIFCLSILIPLPA